MRLLKEELAAFRKAANLSGLPLTAWIRLVCRRAAGLTPG